MAKNSTTSIAEGVKVSDTEIQNEVKEAGKKFGDEPKQKVSIPKNYQKFIGETLPLSINGVTIVLPVDGTQHEIPETFAELLREFINNLTT